MRRELPVCAQVFDNDWDEVILADEIIRLRSEKTKTTAIVVELLEMFNDSGQFMTGHKPTDWAKFLQKARKMMTPTANVTGLAPAQETTK